MPRKSSRSGGETTIAEAAHPAYEAVVAKTDAFCRDHLTDEYAVLCRKLAGVLARMRPSPLSRGKIDGWAAGVVRAIGRVNVLDDPSQTPHLKMTEIDRAFGISLATAQAKSKAIRDLLDIGPLDPAWTLPGRMAENPMAWMLMVNGMIVDARAMPRPFQEEAVRRGLIPYIPGEAAGGETPEAGEASPAPASDRTYTLKITLKDIRPPIWRRIRVPDCTLDELHEHIQTAMGWTNSHLHHFRLGEQYYGDPELMQENFEDMEYKDSTATRLSDIVPAGGKKFRFVYEYDFGDGWMHEIQVEKIEDGKTKAECLAGARACPPEDCGGPWGYPDFLAAMSNPKHENHKDMVEWIGGSFDPEAFDPKAATKAMKQGLPDWRIH